MYAGVFNTMCEDCRAEGHRAPFQSSGPCILCVVTKEMEAAEPMPLAIDVPFKKVRVKRPMKPLPQTTKLTI